MGPLIRRYVSTVNTTALPDLQLDKSQLHDVSYSLFLTVVSLSS